MRDDNRHSIDKFWEPTEMRYLSPVIGLVLLVVHVGTHAADQNGYTARYECRAGNVNCDVDVAALTSATCDQIIAPSTPPTNNWSAVNWANDVICIEGGNHTARGPLTISTSGSSSRPKILRYFRSGDTNDDPWKQAESNRAKLHSLVMNGADHWIIHRLTFNQNESGATIGAFLQNGTSDVILNRLLFEGKSNGGDIDGAIGAWGCSPGTADRYTVQNSVIRNNAGRAGSDPLGVGVDCGSDFRIVNNEIYDYSSHPIQMGSNGGPTLPGVVIENNDVYFTPAMHTSAGALVPAENPIEIKSRGTAAKPIQIFHNRIWGARWSDTSRCCIGGTGGVAVAVVAPEDRGHDYILIANNTLMENQTGIVWASGVSKQNSVIGNIIYKTSNYWERGGSNAIEFIKNNNSEIYLNSIIESKNYWITALPGLGNADVRCNATINAGRAEGSSVDAGTVFDSNVFYATTGYSANGSNQNLSFDLKLRRNATHYATGDILTTASSSACVSSGDPACFLYRVVSGGTSDSQARPYCNSLGCITQDGQMTVQAVRGPYTFYRKLRTSPQTYVIPYVRPHTSAPEAYACPSDYASRVGLGISDEH